jgi:hypothetical protein
MNTYINRNIHPAIRDSKYNRNPSSEVKNQLQQRRQRMIAPVVTGGRQPTSTEEAPSSGGSLPLPVISSGRLRETPVPEQLDKASSVVNSQHLQTSSLEGHETPGKRRVAATVEARSRRARARAHEPVSARLSQHTRNGK